MTPQELASHLVERARGTRPRPETYWEKADGNLASGDDITAMVVNLKEARYKHGLVQQMRKKKHILFILFFSRAAVKMA